MSHVTPAQVSFNGGEISRRLRSRIDQNLYKISLAEMTGYAPLVEGPAEAMPGLIHVAQAPGPFRPIRFEFNKTQGHVLEFSDSLVRVYTNDALLTVLDVPVQVVSPYSWAQVQALKTHQSFDVLYCFHGDLQPREFVRTDATTFSFDLLELENGPFEDRNADETILVSASGLAGDITLTATGPVGFGGIFAAGDVGGLFQIEVVDFGDTPAWEPGITVVAGQLRTSLERVYRAVGGGSTGSWQPSHTEGVEWDGMASGTDINGHAAGGVQWEYIHDKYGIAKITGFTSATEVDATVLRHMPFSAVASDYTYTGGYYDGGWGAYVPPGVAYSYGTWRWRFGAFSDTRGWPTGGLIWNERLCLVKGSTGYASVEGELTDFATLNELGDQSNDMAFSFTIPDPNEIVNLSADDKLLLFTAAGCYALGPSSAASGIGPKNYRIDRQHHSGSGTPEGISLDSRTLTVSRCGTRIYETDFDGQRNVEDATDLTRYARHIGRSGFKALAQQQLPHNFVWAQRGDGSLAAAAYLPDEQVLGWGTRPLADGLLAQGLASITDPDGKFEQIWVAATFEGAWHMLRMAPWREDGESDDTAVMLDMAGAYEGAAATDFSAPLLASRTIQVVADGWFSEVETDGAGAFTLDPPASRVVWGLPYEAACEQLPIEAGGDSGPAREKNARITRAWIETLDARGLYFGAPGSLQPLAQPRQGSQIDTAWDPESGYREIERVSDYTRYPRLRWERRAPFQSTVCAVGCHLDVKQK